MIDAAEQLVALFALPRRQNRLQLAEVRSLREQPIDYPDRNDQAQDRHYRRQVSTPHVSWWIRMQQITHNSPGPAICCVLPWRVRLATHHTLYFRLNGQIRRRPLQADVVGGSIVPELSLHISSNQRDDFDSKRCELNPHRVTEIHHGRFAGRLRSYVRLADVRQTCNTGLVDHHSSCFPQ